MYYDYIDCLIFIITLTFKCYEDKYVVPLIVKIIIFPSLRGKRTRRDFLCKRVGQLDKER